MDSAHCLEPDFSYYVLLISGIQPSVTGVNKDIFNGKSFFNPFTQCSTVFI